MKNIKNNVDGHGVPVPHFRVILEWRDWENLSEKLKSYNIQFIVEPYNLNKDLPGKDPGIGNGVRTADSRYHQFYNPSGAVNNKYVFSYSLRLQSNISI